MTDKIRETQDFNSVNFLWFLWKWRWTLVIIVFVASAAAAVFSGPRFITPMYKSTVVLFPTASNSISRALMDENAGSKNDVNEFGEEEAAEQMLQILNSSVIRDKIINRYNLMNHYEIEKESKYALTNLHKEFGSNITFKRTEFMGVEIKVMDRSPDTAMFIANDIAEYLDSTKNAIQKQRAWTGFKIVEAEYLQMEKEIQSAEDSLSRLRELGVHDYESQSEMINRQLAMEIAKGNTKGIRMLEEKLAILAKYGGPYVSLRDALEHDKKNFAELKSSYKKAKVDAQAYMQQKFVVDSAYKAEKKSYPVRWLILVVAAFSSFILTLIAIIIIENIRRFQSAQSK